MLSVHTNNISDIYTEQKPTKLDPRRATVDYKDINPQPCPGGPARPGLVAASLSRHPRQADLFTRFTRPRYKGGECRHAPMRRVQWRCCLSLLSEASWRRGNVVLVLGSVLDISVYIGYLLRCSFLCITVALHYV